MGWDGRLDVDEAANLPVEAFDRFSDGKPRDKMNCPYMASNVCPAR